MKFRRKLIKFNANEFRLKLEKYQAKEKAEKQIKEFFKDVKAPATDFNANIVEQLLQHLEQLPSNTMQLTGQKVAELKGININYLNQLVKQWEQVKHLQQPNEDDYCIFTESEAENERLAIYNEFIKAYVNLNNSAPGNYHNPMKVRQGLNYFITWSSANEPSPRIEFIKGK
jgi:hypothetical protein